MMDPVSEPRLLYIENVWLFPQRRILTFVSGHLQLSRFDICLGFKSQLCCLFVCFSNMWLLKKGRQRNVLASWWWWLNLNSFHVLLGIFVTEWFDGHLVGKYLFKTNKTLEQRSYLSFFLLTNISCFNTIFLQMSHDRL